MAWSFAHGTDPEDQLDLDAKCISPVCPPAPLLLIIAVGSIVNR